MTTLTEPARAMVRVRELAAHPVAVSFAAGLVLHLLWWLLLANSGGDIAAQDAWAEFARAHPGSAYNLSWYGGMHTASYSLISPFVMAALGVRNLLHAGSYIPTIQLVFELPSYRRKVRGASTGAYAMNDWSGGDRGDIGLGSHAGRGETIVRRKIVGIILTT